MTDHITLESTRLALNFVASTDHHDNERTFMLAMKSTTDQVDRTSIAFNAIRVLAMQIRDAAEAAGHLDHVLQSVNYALAQMLLEEEA